MREFLVGLLFLCAVGVLAGVGLLLFPLIIVLVFFLRIFVIFALVIAAIWLLGKFIMWVWEKIR
jgi:hypothetical protein